MTEQKKMTYVSLLDDEESHKEYEKALITVKEELGKHHPLFIAGTETWTTEEFEIRSPVDRSIVIGHFQKGGEEDAKRAIKAGKTYFPYWSSMEWKLRVKIIRDAALTIDRNIFGLAALMAYEIGKTRTEALAEVGEATDMLRYYCDIYEKNEGFSLPMASPVPGEQCVSILRPYGLWGVISPFNFPLALAAGMISGALLTGNTVIFKPTSAAALSGLRLYEAFMRGGVPPDALQFVTGPGDTFGKVIVSHPDIEGIAFTGSRAVGSWLSQNFADTQKYAKPLVAEMGSKNPVIISAHGDLSDAVEGVVRSAFVYGGQKCSATSRVYVQETVKDVFLDALKARVKELKVGDPRQRATFYGPLIDEHAKKTFLDAVTEAKAAGGSVITGGYLLTEGIYAKGYYAQPTIIAGLPRRHRLLMEELFVPIIVIDTFSTLEEALHEANSTDFGLTAGIFSLNPDEIEYFFSEIKSGVCYANRRGGATTGAWPGAQPFSGWKASGSTGKGVGGPYYLLSFVREQAQTRVGPN